MFRLSRITVVLVALLLVTAVPSRAQNASDAHALQFDGTDDFVAIPNASELGGTPRDERTIEAWFKINDKTIDTRKQVIWEEGGITNGFNLYVFDGAVYVGAWSEANGFGGEWLQTSSIQSGTWHHVALVYDNTSGSFTGYLDGSAFGSVGVSNTIDSHGDDIAFGRMQKDTKFHDGDVAGDGHELQGSIDEGRVWNAVRTQSQIQNNQFSTLSGNETGLAGYWPFEEGSGTTTADLANNNDGTLQNGVSWTSGTAPLSRIWFVDTEAMGANDGTSWADAFTDLQDALATATGTDEIWIAEGTYTPTSGTDRSVRFTVTGAQDRLGIYGGFTSGESDRSERDPSANPVVLSGDIGTSDDTSDNSFHVLFFDGTTGGTITTNTVLDGVTVTAGNANGSGTDNKGGGVLCDGRGSGNGCSPQIRNVTFFSNAGANGGAIYSDGRNEGASTPQITNVIFSGNTVSSQGGAIYSDGRSNGTSTLQITNATFSGNTASNQGGAIYNQGTGGTSSPQITNAILWGNSAPSGGSEIYNNSGSSTLSHTLIEGGVNGSGVGGDNNTDGGNNIDADPLFFDASDPDGADDTFATDDDGLRVLLGSPAIDAGDNAAVPSGVTTDVTGAVRIQDGTVDLGPYEGGVDLPPAAPTGLATTAGDQQVDLSWNANSESDLDGYNVYRSTSSFSDPANATKVNGSLVTGTNFTDTGLSNGTTYHYRITAVDDGGNESSVSVEAAATPTDPAITYYVDGVSGSDANDGQSWGQAFATLQQALSVATGTDQIWVAEGTYYPDEGPGVTDDDRSASFTVTGGQDGLKIYGGFANGDAFGDRSPADHPVVLSGDIGTTGDTSDNSYHVLVLEAATGALTTDTVLDGVTVSGGNANDSSSPLGQAGGGLFCNGNGNACSPTIANVIFTNNRARNGGAMYNRGFDGPSSPLIVNVTFINNQAVNGGAMFNLGNSSPSSPTIVNSTFTNNSATEDSGETGTGGAIHNEVIFGGTSTPTIENTILYGNSATDSGDEMFNLSGAMPTLSHTLIEGGVNGPGVGGDTDNNDGGNNLDADPLFLDPSDPDGADGTFATDDGLRVRLGSPAIDAGDNAAVPSGVTTDITGAARIQDGTVDLGPYEGGVDLPPEAPTGLATTAGDAQVDLSWDANSESDLDGYNVYRATSSFSDPANATKVNGSLVTGTSFTDTGLSNGTTYHYRLTAVDDGANESSLSGEATATPTDPSVTYYVDGASGSDGNDGQSWGQAFATLQKALTLADDTDEVWIAEGTYHPDEGPGVTDDDRGATFTITGAQDGLDIYGGFANGDAFDERSPADHPVVLSGDIGTTGDDSDNSFHVLLFDAGNRIGDNVTANVTTSTRLDGVTVTAGNAHGSSNANNRGGGLFCDGESTGNECSPTIANAIFTNNSADRGGAIYNGGVDGTSSSRLINVHFFGNTAAQLGGAIFNDAEFGGTSSPQIINATFIDNSADDGGAIYNGGFDGTSSPQITNSTFFGNTATTRNGGAIYSRIDADGTGSPTIENTILHGNTANRQGDEIFNLGATPTIANSLIEGSGGSGSGWNTDLGTDEGDNLDADPLYVNSGDPNGTDGTFATDDDGLHVQVGSPAIDAGDDNAVPGGVTTDITGAARIQDGTVDLGAYEGGVDLPPEAPTGLATTAGDGQVDLSWNANSESDLDGYNVYRSTSSFSDLANATKVNGSVVTGTSFTDTGLSNGTTYHHRITAVDDGGNESSLSGEATATPADPITYYVDRNGGSDSNDGTSWGQAFATLQQALTLATNTDEIWIAEGTYYPDEGGGATDDDRSASFTVTGAQDGLEIYGGFQSGDTFADRSPASHPVVLSGDIGTADDNSDNSFHVLLFDGGNIIGDDVSPNVTTATRLDGVTVTAGNADGSLADNKGGGLLCDGSGPGNACSPTIANATFTNNTADSGGGIYNHGEGGASSPTIDNVLFTDNTAFSFGGAINNFALEGASSPEIVNSTFANNSSSDDGGAIFNDGATGSASPQITNVTFSGNTASDEGGAMFNLGFGGTSSPQIANATFTNNSATDGGAILNWGLDDGASNGTSDPQITNVTFSGNSASNQGGAILNRVTSGGTSTPTIENTILHGNSATNSGDEIFNDGVTPTLRHTLIEGGCPSGADCGDGSTILNADPLFLDPNDSDGDDDVFATADDGLRVQAGSPALDAGDNAAVPSGVTTDITGADRIQESTVDLGAYEGPAAVGLTIDGTPGADGTDAGWRFIGIPTSVAVNAGDLRLGGQAPLFDLPDGHMLQRWNDEQGTGTTGGYEPIESADETLQPGRGYAVFLFDQDPFALDPSMTIDVAGDPPPRGGQSVTINPLAQSAQWHLLANPYPTGYDLSSLTDLPGNGFQAQVQRYDATTDTWVVEDQSTTDLAAWQGFFIERTDPGGATPGASSATFDPAGRIPNPPFVGSMSREEAPPVQQARIAFELVVTGAEGDTLSRDAAAQVLFDERAAVQWDAWDGSKLVPLGAEYALLAPEGLGRDSTATRKAVESRPWPTERQEIPLRLTAEDLPNTATATLSVHPWELPDGWRARIVDIESGQPLPLDPGASHEVVLPADTAAAPRYELQVAPTDASLPVELAGFEATEAGEGGVLLQWQTASETNNAQFRVQRKASVKGSRRDASPTPPNQANADWITIGDRPGAGTTTEPQTYRFTDADLPYTADTLAYRLKQIDTDGTEHLSDVITVGRSAVEQVQLHGSFPNPARTQATIRYALPRATDVHLDVYDLLGRRVMTLAEGRQEAGRKQLPLDASRLASGTYFYRLTAGETTRTRKLTVVR